MEEQGKKTLLSLLNKIYASGFIPEDFRRSIYVTIPKKPNATECKGYRTISLIPHVMKLLLKIIQRRIRKKLEDEIAEEQFGVRSGSSTRDGIFTLQTICERAIEMQREIYLCFIYYEKAFDKVQHEKMIKLLDNQNIGKENIRIIRNLYWTQEAAIKIEDSISNWTTIRRGVRQGCIISPLLFNFYTEHIMRESKLENEGIQIGGRQVNNLRYTDDTVLLAGNVEELQNMITKVKETSEKYGLRLNTKKTKVMVVKKTAKFGQLTGVNIQIEGQRIEEVDRFVYLGSMITNEMRNINEIKMRIARAKNHFYKLGRFLTNKKINIMTRKRIVDCYVHSTLI